MRSVAVSVAGLGLYSADAVQLRASVTQNPIRKVVLMLQKMQKTVQVEGEKAEELHDKYVCYCKTGRKDLQASIDAAEEKSPSLKSGIESADAKLGQTQESLKQDQDDRAAATASVAEAKGIREKEAGAFAGMKDEATTNIAAIDKAVGALKAGASSLLQTMSADVGRIFNSQQVASELDRQAVLSFLAGDTSRESGEIIGILEQTRERMARDLDDSTTTEQEAIKTFEGLTEAKAKEIAALTASIESKTEQIGQIGVEIVQNKEDLSDTEAALAADKEFLNQLNSGCDKQAEEWEKRKKMQAEELLALADTIKVLNDDEALQTFSKTLPAPGAPSFLQMEDESKDARRKGQALIDRARAQADDHHKSQLDFLALALSGKAALKDGGFDKVIKLIDDMVKVLKEEQVADEKKKDHCAKEFDSSDDDKKSLERSVSNQEDAIAKTKDTIASVTEDIAELTSSIKALDKSVVEATEQRKAESSETKELVASNSAAKQILGWAKNRLNQVYNPKMYKAPAAQEMSREDQIFTNMGGTPPPTAAPGGVAGTGIQAAFVQISSKTGREAPPPPPAAVEAYSKKSQEGNGVIAMIDLLANELETEITEAQTAEKENQKDYEAAMAASKKTRVADSQSLNQRVSAKADLEGDLETHSQEKQSTEKELQATLKYIASLHADCDWLVKYFDTRKEARDGELDSLDKAKAVLSGADYSFIQKFSSRVLATLS